MDTRASSVSFPQKSTDTLKAEMCQELILLESMAAILPPAVKLVLVLWKERAPPPLWWMSPSPSPGWVEAAGYHPSQANTFLFWKQSFQLVFKYQASLGRAELSPISAPSHRGFIHSLIHQIMSFAGLTTHPQLSTVGKENGKKHPFLLKHILIST